MNRHLTQERSAQSFLEFDMWVLGERNFVGPGSPLNWDDWGLWLLWSSSHLCGKCCLQLKPGNMELRKQSEMRQERCSHQLIECLSELDFFLYLQWRNSSSPGEARELASKRWAQRVLETMRQGLVLEGTINYQVQASQMFEVIG